MDPTPQEGRPEAPSSVPSGRAAIGPALAAVAAAVVLLDAAIETFASGAPLRWWIALSVLAFVVLGAWLWRPDGGLLRRFGWAGAAATSTGGLLVLLAASAWLPGGRVTGVRIASLHTSTLLTLTMAAAVVLATYVLVRAAARLPASARPIVRIGIVAVGLYAVVSLTMAAADRSPFDALFHGGAAWQRLPRWLQGSFLGAMVLVPLAILVLAGRLLFSLRGRRPVRLQIQQALALATAAAIAVSGIGLPVADTAPGAPAPAGRVRPLESFTASEPAAPAVTYSQRQQSSVFQPDPKTLGESFVRAAEEELDRAGADPSDTRAAAEALGFDAQRVFDFLRDEIRFEPYVGVLRGARGTLAARAGNALDRALLGQALLKASGLDSRLVGGTLPADRAERVLARFLAADSTRGPLLSCALEADESARTSAAQDLASKTGLAPDRVAHLLNQASARAEAFWARADEQRLAHVSFLAGQLQRNGIVAPGDGAAVLTQLRQRLERHYWLQVSDDGETWSDFDPSLPDAQRGTAYGSRPAVLEELPEDGFHRFQIDLVYHTTSEGAPAEETLLSGTFVSADVLFEPLEFRIQPAEETPNADELAAMSAGQRIDTLRKYKRFQGLLRAGSEVRAGRAFDLDGRTYNPRDSARGASIGGLFGRVFGAEDEKETAAEFRELQVVLRLTSPGREPFTQTRTLVRAADVRASTFAPPLLEWEILVQPQWLSADLAGFQLLQYLMSVRASIAANVKSGAESARSAQDVPPPYPQQLVQLALLRQRATAAILAERPGVTAFVDEPLLTIAGHRVLALREAEGRIATERTIDIVRNAVRFVGRDRSSRPAAFDAALQQGAADATLEHRFLAETFPESTVSSGVTVLQQSQRERRPIVTAVAGEAERLRRAGLPETDVDWIRANEPADARLLVATAAAPPAAWWSVQPDGTAVLRVSGGRGQGMVEHQTDVMLVALKVQFGLICGYESVHAIAGEGTAKDRWKWAFCTLANAASVGFLTAHAHVASWILIAIETVEFASSGLWEE